MSDPFRRLAALLLLGSLVACAPPTSITLPGGPLRGGMTHDEAMAARTGPTRLDRLPEAAR